MLKKDGTPLKKRTDKETAELVLKICPRCQYRKVELPIHIMQELNLADFCIHMRQLPNAGGVLQQPLRLFRIMQAVMVAKAQWQKSEQSTNTSKKPSFE